MVNAILKWLMSFLHIRHNRPLALRHGFTIVELLIVIVVIGILAAVTIVAFNGLNARANQSAVRSGVKETAKRIELDKVTRGSYAATLNELTNSTKSDDGVSYQYTVSGESFCLTGTLRSYAFNVSTSASIPVEGVCAGHDAPVTGPITDPVVHTQTASHTVTQMSGESGVDIPITIGYTLQPTDYVFILFNSRNNTNITLRNGAATIPAIYNRSMGNSGYQWHKAFGISGLSGQPTLTANACWSTSCPYTGSNIDLRAAYVVYVIRGLGSSPTVASTFTPYDAGQQGAGVTIAPASQSISAGDVAIFSYAFYGSNLPSTSDGSSPTMTWVSDATAPPSHLGSAIAAWHTYASATTSVTYQNTMSATGTSYHGSVLFTVK